MALLALLVATDDEYDEYDDEDDGDLGDGLKRDSDQLLAPAMKIMAAIETGEPLEHDRRSFRASQLARSCPSLRFALHQLANSALDELWSFNSAPALLWP